MGESLFDEMKRYVRFGPEQQAHIRASGGSVVAEIPSIVDEFYAQIEAHPGAVAVVQGGSAQIARLKQTLARWLQELFAGPWDEAYFERRCEIGRRHVRIRLPQHYNFTAMSVLRRRLTQVVRGHSPSAEVADARATALSTLLDLELAIMLHTYHEDHLAQLQRQERLATFGVLTSAIGHELRNPLGVIESSAFLLQRHLAADATVQRHTARIRAQVERSSRIIAGMLEIARDRAPMRGRYAPEVLAERARNGIREERGAEVELVIDDELPEVAVDPEQIHQVLLNLLQNAVEAAGATGRVRLRVTRVEGDVPALECRVEDSGPGIDPGVRARLFEPLVTTKGNGVGLGLALSKKLVEANGGTLTLGSSSELGGATFSVVLPVG